MERKAWNVTNGQKDKGVKMPKLSQIIAIEKSVKNRVNSVLTDLYQRLQKPALISGLSRRYTPKDDEGEKFPPESTRVQMTANDAIREARRALADLLDVTATKDSANTRAVADIVVDGESFATAVPVPTLLFIEKRLVDLHTFVSKIPTLDPSEVWTFDPGNGVYATEPADSFKTKKILRNHVKAEATDKHPAQVDVYAEDVPIGTWRTIKFSGALPPTEVAQMTERIEKLQKAVKFAREEANGLHADHVKIGDRILGYVFGK